MSAQIATTQWSQVLTVRDGSETEARRALEGLCQTYWQPPYAYVRHLGLSRPDANYVLETLSPRIWRLGVRFNWR